MRPSSLICSALALLITGCATDLGKAARKAGINSVALEPRIDVDQPMRIGFKETTGNLSVALANLIVNEMYSKRLTLLSSNMQEHEIRVPDMVRLRAATLLQEAKGFTLATNAAEGALVIAIQQYGFDSAGFSLSRDVPFIVLRAELTRQGKRIWRGTGQAHPFRSEGLGARPEDYLTKPEILREHWELQVERALRALLQTATANSASGN